MIYVAKPVKKAPPSFLQVAKLEARRVFEFFRPLWSGRKKKRAQFEFEAYRHPDLVNVLQSLFHGKCAYCEARYGATGYVEIEHHRPKSIYYWLAADWSNLLPACKRCNNGKLAKFPLERDKLVRKPGDEKREKPLLLNPSDPDRHRRPQKHLKFGTNDGAIHPAVINRVPSLLGEKSIEIYRLSRTELSLERKLHALRVHGVVAQCKEVMTRRSSTTARENAYQALKLILDPRLPFRALTLQILREHGITLNRIPRSQTRGKPRRNSNQRTKKRALTGR